MARSTHSCRVCGTALRVAQQWQSPCGRSSSLSSARRISPTPPSTAEGRNTHTAPFRDGAVCARHCVESLRQGPVPAQEGRHRTERVVGDVAGGTRTVQRWDWRPVPVRTGADGWSTEAGEAAVGSLWLFTAASSHCVDHSHSVAAPRSAVLHLCRALIQARHCAHFGNAQRSGVYAARARARDSAHGQRRCATCDFASDDFTVLLPSSKRSLCDYSPTRRCIRLA